MNFARNAILSTMLAASFAATPGLASAQEAQAPFPRIMVTGEGQATVEPDLAIFTLTVTREAKTAREALDDANAAMAEVLQAMKAEGIEDRDLQTSGFRIDPRYTSQRDRATGEQQPPRIAGYTARNSLIVRLRDLDKVGAVLDKSVTLGVNQGGDVVFDREDPSATIEKARIMAVKDALAKAKTLTEAAGIKLGNVIEMSENGYSAPAPMARSKAVMMDSAGGGAVPVASGELSYAVNVNVTFALPQ